ncbi:hypothetical protein phiOC_p352 [Ochrobactrum phage vB_OspM_OC]|nr:hypothetical protein phiOC_p352 [Ochrobactrum phage vB_OspM_OC]
MNVIHNSYLLDFMDNPFIDAHHELISNWKWINFASGWYGFNIRRSHNGGITLMQRGGIRQNFFENQKHQFSTVFFEMRVKKLDNQSFPSPNIGITIHTTNDSVFFPALNTHMHYVNYSPHDREWLLKGEMDINDSIDHITITNNDSIEIDVNKIRFSPIPFHEHVMADYGYLTGNNCRDHIEYIDVQPHTGISTNIHEVEFEVPLLTCPTFNVMNVQKENKGVLGIKNVNFGALNDKAVLTYSTSNIEKKSTFIVYFSIEPLEI